MPVACLSSSLSSCAHCFLFSSEVVPLPRAEPASPWSHVGPVPLARPRGLSKL